MSLTKCPRCEKHGNPKPQWVNNYDADPAFFVCEFCGWKLPKVTP